MDLLELVRLRLRLGLRVLFFVTPNLSLVHKGTLCHSRFEETVDPITEGYLSFGTEYSVSELHQTTYVTNIYDIYIEPKLGVSGWHRKL